MMKYRDFGHKDKAPIIMQSLLDGNDTTRAISQDTGINRTKVANKLNVLCNEGIVQKYIPAGQPHFPYHYRFTEAKQ